MPCPNVGGVSGLHFLPNDPADLVRAMRKAMEPMMHEGLVKALPQPSTAREMARRYLDFFDEALLEPV
ncbi:hypothetical protein [Sabulicella rubraurantiaca]|uniref:hypothetical protein n=1 Tax=Sabulicella rubraurantiaca TaxID=2811429 RepID=UPI001A969184|nr:hypothetical protein [Sabulicella rubraurantiaca]